MRKFNFPGLLPSLTAVAFAVSATALSAQSDETQTQTQADSSGWGVQCNNTANGLQCAATMNVVSNPDNQRIFSISFQEAGEAANPTLVLQLPFGLNLPRGVDLAIDEGDPQTFVVNTCLQTGCFVVQESDQALIDAMMAGNMLTVLMESSNSEETRMELPLAGFSAAMDRLE